MRWGGWMGCWEVAAGVAVAVGRFKIDIHDKASLLCLEIEMREMR
jgi:hypothetical protein